MLSTKEAVFTIARRGSSVQSGISMNKTLQYDQYPFNPLQNQSIDDACHSTVMYQEAFLVFVLEINASNNLKANFNPLFTRDLSDIEVGMVQYLFKGPPFHIREK